MDLTKIRRDLSVHAAYAASSTAAFETPPVLTISRGVARGLFALIQIAYLVMYSVPFYKFAEFYDRLETGPARSLRYAIGLSLVCGTAIRLYLLTAVAFDYEDLGRKFRVLFPFLLAVDLGWSASPLLLLDKLKGLAIAASAALAFLPFSQRTVLTTAYAPRGGRSSAIRALNVLDS